MLPVLAAAVAIAVFVAAGNWQRGRMQQKEAWGEQLDAAQAAPAAPFPGMVADWSAWRFRSVEARGTFDAARQFLVDNKVHRGRAGYHVVTPLRLADGGAVLVDRGWIAAGATRLAVPAVPVPEGEVVVRGRLNVPPGYVELERHAPERGVWQNLDPARFAQATGLAVPPVVIEAIAGAGEGLARDWPRPDSGANKHRMYMLQWYAFAALVAGLWAWFAWRGRR